RPAFYQIGAEHAAAPALDALPRPAVPSRRINHCGLLLVAAPGRVMPVTTVAAFVAALRAHEILEPAPLQEVTEALAPQFTDVESFAQELVRRSWLTDYQVEQVKQDRVADLVFGPFVLLDWLGGGGMGEVF